MWGLDLLGAARYRDLAIREMPAGWALGVFGTGVFGDSRPVVRALLGSRCPVARVHLLWSDTHSFGEREIKAAVAEAKRWKDIAKDHGRAFQVSPWCEHNASAAMVKRVIDAVMQVLPDATPINTPWKGSVVPGIRTEVHGNHAKPKGPYQWSYDGLDARDADNEHYAQEYGDAEIEWLWCSQMNGRKNANDTTPRPQRKAWPTPELIDGIVYLHRARGPAKLPKRWIWKAFADQHMVPPEPRALKPVLISPVKAARFELVADSGQVVAVSSGSQPFSDGRFRYYWPTFGHLLAQKAQRLQGHSTCKLVAGGKVYGTVEPGFRINEWRNK